MAETGAPTLKTYGERPTPFRFEEGGDGFYLGPEVSYLTERDVMFSMAWNNPVLMFCGADG